MIDRNIILRISFRDMIFEICLRLKKSLKNNLKNVKPEYFDFYLFHNVCEKNIDAYLNPKYKILSIQFYNKKAREEFVI